MVNAVVIRDVQNRIDFLILVRFLKKLGFSSEWVWFDSVKKLRFGLDIIVIYYSRNSWVVNLQQILEIVWATITKCYINITHSSDIK